MQPKSFYVVSLLALIFVSTLIGCGDEADSSSVSLRILVTNDDGFAAEGIDAVVEALVADSNNEVIVCAPDMEQSGTSDNTECGTLVTEEKNMLSGYPATAINGCPADAVNYALENLYSPEEQPHIVISGINGDPNVSAIGTALSGTIGAAKTAARSGVPALAASQARPHEGGRYDFPSGAEAVLAWLADNRTVLLQNNATPTDITSLNIPSCNSGSVRGTRIVSVATEPEDIAHFIDPQDCESTLENPANDVEALINGFIAQTSIPLD